MWEHLVMARKCGATNYVYSWTHMDANLANLAISKSYPRPFCRRLFGHFFIYHHLPNFRTCRRHTRHPSVHRGWLRSGWITHVSFGMAVPPLPMDPCDGRCGRAGLVVPWPLAIGDMVPPYRLSHWSNKELAENEWKQHDFNTDQQ